MLRLFLSRPLAEPEFTAWTTPGERAQAAEFAPARRAEWLSWRALVRRELNAASLRFGYDGAGAPFIEGSALRLSVSHCEGSIAVALSETPCAVDIELLARDFGHVVSRYAAPEERILSDDPLWPALVWCAKETLYKSAGRRNLDLLCDLRIESVDFAAGTLVGRICDTEPLVLRFFFLAGRVVVYRSQS